MQDSVTSSCSHKTAGGGINQKPLASHAFATGSAASQVVHGTGPHIADRACGGRQGAEVSESNLQIFVVRRYLLGLKERISVGFFSEPSANFLPFFQPNLTMPADSATSQCNRPELF